MPYLCLTYKLSSNIRPWINQKQLKTFFIISNIVLSLWAIGPYIISIQSAQAQDPIFNILPATSANSTTPGGTADNTTTTPITPPGGDMDATFMTNDTTVPPFMTNDTTVPPFMTNDTTVPPFMTNDTTVPPPIGPNATLPADNITAFGGEGQPGAEGGAPGEFGGGGEGQPGAEGGAPGEFGGGGEGLPQLNETVPGLTPTVEAPALPPPITQILSNNTGDSTNPNVAVSGSNLYVVWEDTSSGNREILLIRSHDGSNFTSTQTLSNSPGESFDPRIAVSGSNVYVVWEDTATDGSSEVKFAKSADNGATFGSVQNLSNQSRDSTNPNITVSGSNVYVVWEDTTAAGSSDILLARSTNNGATFGVVHNLSNSPVESFDPTVVASKNKLFVTWSDDKEGDAEIIFTDRTRNIASANVSAPATTTEPSADLGLGAGGGDLGFGGGTTGGGFGTIPGDETATGGGFGTTPPDATGGGFGTTPPDATGGGFGTTPPDATGGGFGTTPPDATGGGFGTTPPDATGGGFGTTPGAGGTAGGFQTIPPS